ncbi:MAG: family 78 glycoside hydrolase catalytic domain [Bythopirellula sp.]
MLRVVRLADFLLLLLAFVASTAKADLSPDYLRTEYRVNPCGIETRRPRLSWIVASEERGQRQTAYRVLVASSAEQLNQDVGDLWDSGKVDSSETASIAFAGEQLTSRKSCYWKVKVWDAHGRSNGWSKPATWSMGLLDHSDWTAKWIGYDKPSASLEAAPQEPPHLEQAKWIWHSEGDAAEAAPLGTRCFLRRFSLPTKGHISSATLTLTGDNHYAVFVNGTKIGRGSDFTVAEQFEISQVLTHGENTIAIEVTNEGQTTNPAGLIGALIVESDKGTPLVILTDHQWKSSATVPENWPNVECPTNAWQPVKEVVSYGDAPWGKIGISSLRLPPPCYLRTSFPLNKPIRRATVYGTALGVVDLHLNGKRVSDEYFAPGWTDYDRRVYYRAHDVTDLLRKGENALGAILADGWYAGYVGTGYKRDHYGTRTRCLIQLEIEFEDGTHTTIASGPNWRASTGPLLEADFLMGEKYDARLESSDWNKPGFDDADWNAVDVADAVAAQVQSHPGEPVREMARIQPVEITEPQPGRFVVNFGQNFSGIVRVKVRGERGQRIQLRHAERLNPDGTIYTENLRTARAIDTYICNGRENGRSWQPRFTFHGFQYVEISGYSGTVSLDDVLGIPLSTDTPIVGSFECSDEMTNKLFSNIYWTQRMNHIDVPTDCPQRDERLGWTGDAQVYIRTATLLADVQSFYTKWLVDLDDGQRADGQYPMVAPLKSHGVSADGGPAWADAGVICPWNIYEVYGDRRLLEQHYDNMARFIEFCRRRSTEELLPPESFHCFGDWLSIDDDTPKDVIYLVYFANSTQLMAQAAQTLGKDQDQARYEKLWAQVKAAFRKAYVTKEGRIKGDTQTAYVLALRYGLVDDDQRQAAADRLVQLIADRGYHLSTGFIGTKDLMLVLSDIGRNDIAYRLLHNTTFPSWGFSIVNGATSIWERWNGWTPENGFFDPSMNSFAHYSFGAVAQWMFETIGGIKTDGPGFRRIVIRPQPGGAITWANVSYKSIRGRIATKWKLAGNQFVLEVEIPANTTAEVHVPTGDVTQITESEKPIESVSGIKFLREENAAAIFEVVSGNYLFSSPLAR